MEKAKGLEKYITGENGIGYTLGEDGLYYPDLKLPEEGQYNIGKYGLMRCEYLKTCRRWEYIWLLLAGELHRHLHEVDEMPREDRIFGGADESQCRNYRRIEINGFYAVDWSCE